MELLIVLLNTYDPYPSHLIRQDIRNESVHVNNKTTFAAVVEFETSINTKIYLGQCCLFHGSTESSFHFVSYIKLTFARHRRYCTKEKTVNLYMVIICAQSSIRFTTDFNLIFYILDTIFSFT